MTVLTEEEVRALIERVYCRKYIGKIKLTELYKAEGPLRGYLIEFGLNNDERPLSIAFDGSKDEFLRFLEKELRMRSLHSTDYFTGEKLR